MGFWILLRGSAVVSCTLSLSLETCLKPFSDLHLRAKLPPVLSNVRVGVLLCYTDRLLLYSETSSSSLCTFKSVGDRVNKSSSLFLAEQYLFLLMMINCIRTTHLEVF